MPLAERPGFPGKQNPRIPDKAPRSQAARMKFVSPKIHAGIDIGSSSIKAVGLCGKTGSYEIAFSECIDLPARYSLQKLGDLENRHFSEQLADIARKHRLGNKPVSICLNVAGGVTHLIRFEVHPMESAFESLVQDELERILGGPIDDMTVSCHQCKSTKNALEVAVCGIPNPTLERTRALLAPAGLRRIEGLEPDMISLFNAFMVLKGELLFESAIIVNIGTSKTDCIGIAHGANPFFRQISLGTATIIEALTEEFAVNWQEADEMLPGLSVHGMGEEENFIKLDDFLSSLLHELQQCLSDFLTISGRQKLSKILLTGGFSQLVDLPNRVETALEVSTEVWDPFGDVKTPLRRTEDGVRFCGALGAALGGMQWS